MNPSATRNLFRIVAVAEALSWAGLLIGMFLKYVVEAGHEGGVPVLGMIHGVMFVLYVLTCLLARRAFGWGRKTTLLALASAIPPFCTYVFEVAADKRGLLRPQKAVAPR